MHKFAMALAGLVLGSQAALAGSATYTVTFDGTWTAATHPIEYPSNAHFSGLIGATHDARYALFREGATATDGLEHLSEMGAHSPLDTEIRAAIAKGVAGALIESGPLFNLPKSTSASFQIDDRHSMVSLVAMIAPSPDWFTGVADLKLMVNGKWVARQEITLYAWDAGTDNGTTYAATDIDAQPRGKIMANQAPHFMAMGKAVPVGKLVFEKTSESPKQVSQQ